ncbi:hypothetical protein Ciccas_007513 [Cichlidogyrus casuarinus]|uniref:NUP160 middle TPR domain-containing protein n=1 Tax=Cichlidogyrus casuarinus TaxID=1844966 RepID=A0ABD2Q2Q1_9PLAT
MEENEQTDEDKVRAAVDEANPYYDLLYAFHIKQDNFRFAAATTYEYAVRLSEEVEICFSTDAPLMGSNAMLLLRILQKYASLLLITINALSLVNPKVDQWLVKPARLSTGATREHCSVSWAFEEVEASSGAASPEPNERMSERVVVTMADLYQEYSLLKNRLKLIQTMSCEAEEAGQLQLVKPSAEEILVGLLEKRLYQEAFCLASQCDLQMRSLVVAVCDRIFEVNQYNGEEPQEADLEECNRVKAAISSLSSRYISSSNSCFLAPIAKASECTSSPGYHIFRLPQWLYMDVNLRVAENVQSSVLRLFIEHDRIAEAHELALDIVASARGLNTACGKMQSSLINSRMQYAKNQSLDPVWLPHRLLFGLNATLKSLATENHEFLLRKDDPRLGSLMVPFAQACMKTKPGCMISLVGYAVDLGVKLNGGRVGAASGPATVAQLLPKLGALHNREYQIDLHKSMLTNMQITEQGESQDIFACHDQHYKLLRNSWDASSLGMIISVGGGNDQSWPNGKSWIDHLRAGGSGQKLAVINVDAHLDVRPLLDGDLPHSGSPFRQLLEYTNEAEVIDFGELIVVWIGGLAIRNVIWLSQLRKNEKSVSQQLEALLSKYENEQRATFFSFDIDAIRGADAPGVSCPAPRGFSADEALQMCFTAGKSSAVSLFDISEFNPAIESDRTCRLVCQMIYHFILGYSLRC